MIEYLDASVPELLVAHGVPGATVALVVDGSVAWSGAYGVRDAGDGEPMRPDDPFQVASVSKPVAAYTAMRLVQDGRLDLDAPIGAYLTRWQLPGSTWPADGVTARRLLSHTAGLSTESYPGLAPDADLPGLEASLEGDSGADPVRLIDEPGTGYRYSGGGYTVIQLALEEASGTAFAELVSEEVFEPLGMTDSTYDQAAPRGAPTPHDGDAGALPWYAFVELAAAGLISTAPDLGRFLAGGILRPDAERGLSPELLVELLAPQPETDDAYALGFFVERPADGLTVIGHAGANAGWRSKLLAIPEHDAGIVVLTNGEGGDAVHVEIGCTWIAWVAALGSADEACP